MTKQNPGYNFFWNVYLSFIVVCFTIGSLNAQEQVKSATEKLAVLSENMAADDTLEIRRLLKAGADVDVKNKNGVTPLFMASQEGYTEIVKLLLAAKADVNAARTNGATSLIIASLKGHTEIVKLLLTAKADVNTAATKLDVTPLILASREGYIEIVKLLLAAKADVNATAKDSVTPLLIASQEGHTEVVRLLLAAKADVNAVTTDKDKVTPLFMASQKDFIEIVKLLLAAKADVNTTDTNGVTPLIIASQEGHTEVVKLLLAAKADVNAATTNGETPLYMASQEGHTELVKLLQAAKAKASKIEQKKMTLTSAANSDVRNVYRRNYGETMLMQMSSIGFTKQVKLLLEAKVDVNAATPNGLTPLILASLEGHSEIVKLLLAAKADVNASAYLDDNEYTALSIAEFMGHTEVVKLLLAANAYVNSPITNGEAPVDKALQKDQNSTAKLVVLLKNMTADDTLEIRRLLKAGADIEVKNKYGETPLYIASSEGCTEVVKLLLAAKADVNAHDRGGATPLWIASARGYSEIIKLLLATKADVNVHDSIGYTSLMIASQEGHTEVVKLLLAAKADVNVYGSGGWTSLMIASQEGHAEIVNLLLAAKADVDATGFINDKKYTALSLAESLGHTEVIKMLLAAKADVNSAIRNGETPLYKVSQKDQNSLEIGLDQISGNQLLQDLESGTWFLVGTGQVKNFDITNLINEYKDYIGFDINSIKGSSTDASMFIDNKGRWKVTGTIGGAAFLKQTPAEGFTLDENFPKPLVLLFKKGYKLTVTMEKGAETFLNGKKVRSLKNISFALSDGDDSEFNSRINEGVLKEIKDSRVKTETVNDILPAFSLPLSGRNEVRIVNPNDFSVSTGLRSGNKGKDFIIPGNDTKSIYVSNGEYDIYFVYSDKPNALFQGDSFTLENNGVEIQIVKVVNGNYDIKQVK